MTRLQRGKSTRSALRRFSHETARGRHDRWMSCLHVFSRVRVLIVFASQSMDQRGQCGSSTHPRSTSAEELCCHRTARAIHQDGKGHQCAQTRSSQLAWPVQRLRQRHHKQRLGPGCRTHSESLPCVSPVRRSGAHQERRARNDRHIPAVPGEQSVGGWQERAPPRWRW